jgi:hypothetical protein
VHLRTSLKGSSFSLIAIRLLFSDNSAVPKPLDLV